MRSSLETIGRTVYKMRKKLGLKADEFAEACDLSVQSISDIERGKRLFQIDTLEKICDGLRTNPNVLLGYNEYSPKEHMAQQLEGFDEQELELVQALITQIRKTYHRKGKASVQ